MKKNTHSSSSDTKMDPTVEQLGRDTQLAAFLTISSIGATIVFWYMILY